MTGFFAPDIEPDSRPGPDSYPGEDADRPQPPPARPATSHALEQGRNRLLVTAAVFTLGFAAVCVRLVGATLLNQGAEPHYGQSNGAAEPHLGRADILDRNGMVLATSLTTASLYADPALILEPAVAARKLVTALPDLNYNDLLEKLKSDRRFVWIKRNLPPRQHYAVHRLGIPGLSFQREERRFYPAGPLTSHVVGFTGVDNNGLAGLEQSFDKKLRDRSGTPVQVSLDLRLQHIVKRELQASIAQFSAVGGASMVLDTRTGEILAMVSLPDYDPQTPTGLHPDTLFNRNTLGVYEMGSTFKIFNTAMALDSGKVRIGDSFDAVHNIHYGRFTISEYHGKNRWLTVPEIFQYSSNLGSVRMALQVGTEAQRAFMAKLGMLRAPALEIPEVGAPMFPNPWREINTMTISFGHGIAVSPVHVVTAAAAVVNGGILHPPTLLRRPPGVEVPGERVISPQTSEAMRRLFRLVVTEGTAKGANAPGYLVGGKTGTAEKQTGRRYSRNARMSSFVGAFPMSDPRYMVFVMVDEPKGTKESQGYATGGWVAAPAVGRIVRQIGPLLGVPMTIENQPALRSATAPDSNPKGSTLASFPDDGRTR